MCNKKKQAFCCPCEDNPCVPTSDCPQVVVFCLVVVVEDNPCVPTSDCPQVVVCCLVVVVVK